MPFTLKFIYDSDLRRISLPEKPSFENLRQLACITYSLPAVVLKYRDLDGDMCTIGSEHELSEALDHLGSALPRFEVSLAPGASVTPATATATPSATPSVTAITVVNNTASTPLPSSSSNATRAREVISAETLRSIAGALSPVLASLFDASPAEINSHMQPLLHEIDRSPEVLNTINPILDQVLTSGQSLAETLLPMLIDELKKRPELLQQIGPFLISQCVKYPTVLAAVAPILIQQATQRPELMREMGPLVARMIAQHPDLLQLAGPVAGPLLAALFGGANANASPLGLVLSALASPQVSQQSQSQSQSQRQTQSRPYDIPEPPTVNNNATITPEYENEAQLLVDMGFQRAEALAALRQTRGDINDALTMLAN